MSRSGPRLVRSVRIEVWSDVVCPWCYIGKRRLEDHVACLTRSRDAVRRYLETVSVVAEDDPAAWTR